MLSVVCCDGLVGGRWAAIYRVCAWWYSAGWWCMSRELSWGRLTNGSSVVRGVAHSMAMASLTSRCHASWRTCAMCSVQSMAFARAPFASKIKRMHSWVADPCTRKRKRNARQHLFLFPPHFQGGNDSSWRERREWERRRSGRGRGRRSGRGSRRRTERLSATTHQPPPTIHYPPATRYSPPTQRGAAAVPASKSQGTSPYGVAVGTSMPA